MFRAYLILLFKLNTMLLEKVEKVLEKNKIISTKTKLGDLFILNVIYLWRSEGRPMSGEWMEVDQMEFHADG